jgi:hypothetical protein
MLAIHHPPSESQQFGKGLAFEGLVIPNGCMHALEFF